MKLEIHPYVGVGPIRFGMSRSEVRAAIAHTAKTFLKGPDSVVPTDAFDEIGVHVYYKQNETCEAVEMFLMADPTFRGERLRKRPFNRLAAWLKTLDPNIVFDNTGLTSFEFGFGFYAPSCEEHPSDPVEAVIVFEKGYYDAP